MPGKEKNHNRKEFQDVTNESREQSQVSSGFIKVKKKYIPKIMGESKLGGGQLC